MTLRDKLRHPDAVVAVNGRWAETWGVNGEGFGVVTYCDNGNDGEVYIEPYIMGEQTHVVTVSGVTVAVYRAVPFR